jgi:methylmalonyl-CoA/ethylmalonyl-CoA epimerase
MKILNIDHIGVAAKSIDQAAPFWSDVLGLSTQAKETVREQNVSTLSLSVGESAIEVLESTTADGAVARFIQSRGEGVQHIALRVDDLDAALEELKQKGVRLIDERPRTGAGGSRIAFLHPQATHGILLELVERAATRD